jgi:8-oxo-dGTP diphosphatase
MMRKKVDVAAAVLTRPDGAFLLGQRAADTFYPGYWEFPGGKVEPGESPREALVRELREELGIEVVRADPWITREHAYEHAHVRLHFFRVPHWRGDLQDHVHAALAWQRPGSQSVAPMLPANAPVLKALALPVFYGITRATDFGVDRQIALAERAFGRGLRLVQVREAELAAPLQRRLIQALLPAARRHDARLLISGDAGLARESGADGVHLSARQLMAATARPEFPLVGASCHRAVELEQAARLDLDFVVLGPVRPTASHPGAPGMGWEAFASLVAGYPLPVFAIGGLAPADLETAWSHGAHGIAAIRSAWQADAQGPGGGS